jgi:hypothetical protein
MEHNLGNAGLEKTSSILWIRGEVSPRVSLNVEQYKEETSASAGNKTKPNQSDSNEVY